MSWVGTLGGTRPARDLPLSPRWMVLETLRRSSRLVSRMMRPGARTRNRMTCSHTLVRMMRR